MYIKLILSIVLLCVQAYAGILYGKGIGRESATALYNLQIEQYKQTITNQTEALNQQLQIKSVDLSKEVQQLLKDTADIKKQLKNQPQPLVLINQGECIASNAALEARRKMIERVNK